MNIVGPLSRDMHAWNFHILQNHRGEYVAIATTQINNSHINDTPLHIGVGTMKGGGGGGGLGAPKI